MNAEEYLKRGIEYFEKGDYDRAIADTSEAIRLNPTDAIAYGTRGAAYKGKNDFDSAIADLTEAIRLDPNNVPAYGNRGLTYLAKEDYNQAISDLEMALKIQPENDGVRQTLEGIKAELSGNNSGNIKSKKTGKFILMGIGLVIGGIIGSVIGGFVGLLICAFWGIGIVSRHFGLVIKEEVWNHLSFTWECTTDMYYKEGFKSAIGQFLFTFIIMGLWHLIKLVFRGLISPFVVIYQLVTDK